MVTAQAYAYRGRNKAGRVVSGRLEAANESAAATAIRGLGLSPIQIGEVSSSGLQMEIGASLFRKRVGLKDLSVMSRQMATMIASGLSLLRTLAILSEQTENATLAKAIGDVRQDVESGSALSDALARRPEVFPPLFIHLMRAGEVGGFLDKALSSVAQTFEADVKLRGSIKSALSYPIIVLCIAILAVIGMLIFIVPVFEHMFDSLGGQLPAPTEVLVVISHNMIWIGPLLVVVILAATAWWRKNKRRDEVRKVADTWKLKLPVFGMLMGKVAIARFSRNLATMTVPACPCCSRCRSSQTPQPTG